MSLDATGDRPALPPRIWLFFVVLGVIWMILGLLAIGEPYVATDIAVKFIAVLLLVGGGRNPSRPLRHSVGPGSFCGCSRACSASPWACCWW